MGQTEEKAFGFLIYFNVSFSKPKHNWATSLEHYLLLVAFVCIMSLKS